ncbi:unnamed protein product [Ectocarpus sp. CCAP 1310/34]|nr:unnamed protein product [Ectocarpus sp. CCAP 1310/34]
MASGDTRGMLKALAAMLKDTETKTRMVQKVGCFLRLLVGDDNGLFLDLTGAATGAGGAVPEGETKAQAVEAILHLSDADFASVCAGQLSPEKAFMRGRLVVRGNLVHAMKCGPVFELLRPPPPRMAPRVAPSMVRRGPREAVVASADGYRRDCDVVSAPVYSLLEEFVRGVSRGTLGWGVWERDTKPPYLQ